ncbi:MAG TPA: DUF4339 domain-containing protein [Tepidisphaeraceae bacterium]|nr:DUF4339 domain-containing protein [Tepidisphaeraceae bacterium]
MTESAQVGKFLMSRGGEQFGPFSFDEVLSLVQQGRLVASDFVWTQGWVQWCLASDVPELFPEPSPLEQLAQARSGQSRAATPRARVGPDGIICPNPNCCYRGRGIRRRKGSFVVLVLLLLIWLLPGVLYAIFYNGEILICPRCGMKIRDA